MKPLNRTTLTTSEKVDLAARSLLSQDLHGAVSATAQAHGVSRPTVYKTAELTQRLLERHFEQPYAPSQVTVDEALLNRAMVALRVVGRNSIRNIEDLLPILYPGTSVSYGKIQEPLVLSEQSATHYNESVDLSRLQAGALDEMYSQGSPVLAGIDLAHGYLFSLTLKATCSADDWEAVLAAGKSQGLDLKVVVKDAAKGIAKGVERIFPEAEQRDDCFHVLYEMNKVRRKLEASAYAAIAEEERKRKLLGKIRAKEKKARRLAKYHYGKSRKACEAAIADYEHIGQAYYQIRCGLECVDIENETLHTKAQVKQLFEAAAHKVQQIGRADCQTLAHYLLNRAPGLSLATEECYQSLQALTTDYSMEHITLVCLFILMTQKIKKSSQAGEKQKHTKKLMSYYSRLKTLREDTLRSLITAVEQCLQHRYRASSAIEGFNAALRPHLYVHKGVTQGFLELFRAYQNLRQRRWGRHQGTSATQCMTGERVTDWLTCLGYPPSKTIH